MRCHGHTKAQQRLAKVSRGSYGVPICWVYYEGDGGAPRIATKASIHDTHTFCTYMPDAKMLHGVLVLFVSLT
jgi:hypothetical protein